MIKQVDDSTSFFSFIVGQDSSLCRIDTYISKELPYYSRNYLQGIINQGNVTLNGIVIKKPSAVVRPNDTITVQFPPKTPKEPAVVVDKTMGVVVLAETEHFLIIHKPAPLLVHPPSLTSKAITLSDWIRHYYGAIDVGSSDRPGIIHRLDRDTSGIMIITKTPYAHNVFGSLFRERTITKTYKAVVQGHPPREGFINYAIGRDPVNRIRMAYFNPELMNNERRIGDVKVRHAETDYKVLEYFDNASLVEVTPKTGRTHQIRIHMAAIGHPIIGDSLYGKTSPHINRQALHAESLSFVFDEQSYYFNDPLPIDMVDLINVLRSSRSI